MHEAYSCYACGFFYAVRIVTVTVSVVFIGAGVSMFHFLTHRG